MEQLQTQLCSNGDTDNNGSSHGNRNPNPCPKTPAKVHENGKAENEEINVKGGFRVEKPKYRSAAAPSEPGSPKAKNRELSPQHRRETRLRSREPSHPDESSTNAGRRAVSPAHKTRRTPKTPTTTPSDNGLRETGRAMAERAREGASRGASGSTSSGEGKKPSVLSRYPPAANDQKHWKSAKKETEVESKKSKLETRSKVYSGSDSESNQSDGKANSVSSQDKDSIFASDLDLDAVKESVTVPLLASKANGSYTAYRSHVTPLLPGDQGSEGGHSSSASETESTGSRRSDPDRGTEASTVTTGSARTATPRYPRYSGVRDPPSEGSSTRSSFDEELHSRGPQADPTPSGIDLRRTCSPREALRSKAVIKPAIVESDRKEVMMSEASATNGKPKISTKPVAITAAGKMTSSITIYPNDPGSSRTSSRSSSVSSEPMSGRERHTSTSNILIGTSQRILSTVHSTLDLEQ